MLPKAGHAKQSVIRHANAVRLFALPYGFPFVERICRNQTVVSPIGVAEGWLVRNGFSASVDKSRAYCRVLGPGWNQPPFEKRKLPALRRKAHYRDHLTWGDVVMGRDVPYP